MSDVTGVNSALSQYDIADKKPAASNNDLGKTEFLELMIAQLNNQNPLEPQDDAAFIAELAQFSTVEGIQSMSDGFEDLAVSYKSSQALQASALVGGSVTVDGNDSSPLQIGELIFGVTELDAGSDGLHLQIENAYGEIVEDVELGYQPSGPMSFKWDGANLEVNGELADIDYDKFAADEDGNLLPHEEGDYTFRILGDLSGQQQTFATNVSRRVESVTILGGNEIQLNLAGGGQATLDEIKQINAVY
ncbi:flagellar hook assembly protein FlgD [Reinekea sp.]|jgi:flagellar basal-body rod modification protein FlgD|uniref:flagellar hook assembly protein FlgD n=1 Tax=Reinekea sp. TaxID=1970455 RepID=UPI002A7FB3EF|nr:flagellar hook capping FlgD N-terminal domain-containing protein [Reinekea sp.]